jgi:hypothetical protein
LHEPVEIACKEVGVQPRNIIRLSSYPRAIIRGGMIYAVTVDEFDVPFVVRARLGSPSTVERGRARELVGGG